MQMYSNRTKEQITEIVLASKKRSGSKCTNATDANAESFGMESVDFFRWHSKLKQTNDRSTDLNVVTVLLCEF